MKNYTSKVTENTPRSYRTTIPQGIVQLMELDGGDTIEWMLNISDNKVNVCIKKHDEE